MKHLVFVHGRAQEHKDAVALKREWLGAFREGLAKNRLNLPIPENAVRFPYYGQTLYGLMSGVPPEQIAEVIVRGHNGDDDERAFMRAVIQDVKLKTGINDTSLEQVAGRDVIARGPLNWEWLQAVLRVIDRNVPFASGASIALATRAVPEKAESGIPIRCEFDSSFLLEEASMDGEAVFGGLA